MQLRQSSIQKMGRKNYDIYQWHLLKVFLCLSDQKTKREKNSKQQLSR